MGIYLVLAILLVMAVRLLKNVIDGRRECKRQKRLELYRQAELIGRRRIDMCIPEKSKTQS